MAQEQKAVTVSEYVTIVPGTVADTRIISATQSAAEIYGYDTPDKLVGRFLSQTLDRNDMLRGCLMSLARIKGRDIPTRYPTKIVRPNGEIVPVIKDTTQIETKDRIMWITQLEIIPDVIVSEVPTPSELGLSDHDILKYRGLLNIADLEMLLASHGIAIELPLTISEPHHIISESDGIVSELHHMMSGLQSKREKQVDAGEFAPVVTGIPQVDIGLGQTRRLPDGDYLHRCARCHFVWQSADPNPDKCPRSRADRRSPQACGVRR